MINIFDRWRKVEKYLGTRAIRYTLHDWVNQLLESKMVEVPIYKTYNKKTGKIYKIYGKYKEAYVEYNIEAYEIDGKFIQIQ